MESTWVFVAGTYRTASTTQYQITRDIVEETHNGIGIGHHQESKLAQVDGGNARYVVCKVFEFLPDGFRGKPSLGKCFLDEGRLKAVCTIRDPRDIIVSMRKRSVDLGKDIVWEGNSCGNQWSFVQTACRDFPKWLGDLEKWANLGTDITLVSRFEEFTRNLYREVMRIAEHLDIDIADKQAKDIASRYTISAMAQRKRTAKAEGVSEDPWLPSVPTVVFGSSGLYNTWLSYRERELVEKHNGDFMRRFGYL